MQFKVTFYQGNLTYYFRISKPFVKILETHGKIDKNLLKNEEKIKGEL